MDYKAFIGGKRFTDPHTGIEPDAVNSMLFPFQADIVRWALRRGRAAIFADSSMSRQGIPDYLVTMRKPGENAEPIAGELDRFVGEQETFQSNGRMSIDIWQRYASPVWMDINPSRTLQKESAREEKDERHICPLQLDVIERACQLWSKEGDVVLSPFMGIGSEGYVAVGMGRKFVGIELKGSYYEQAVLNLAAAEHKQVDLFNELA
jgi:DNA modification methylase